MQSRSAEVCLKPWHLRAAPRSLSCRGVGLPSRTRLLNPPLYFQESGIEEMFSEVLASVLLRNASLLSAPVNSRQERGRLPMFSEQMFHHILLRVQHVESVQARA